MSSMWITELEDRAVVALEGDDTVKLLQGLITNDMTRLGAGGGALHAALLTPQGKIMFEFFVIATAGGVLLETARERTAELAKRLTFYRLRAAVRIDDQSARWRVLAGWQDDAAASPPAQAGAAEAFADPRAARLGWRAIVPKGGQQDERLAPTATAGAYHAHRIGLGVPEAGRDYMLGDTFPHEADLDLLNGVDFDKGCFVGQEVVARMQHKSVVRKRVVKVAAAEALPADQPEVVAGAASIGRLGSVAGRTGLALLRLDRVAEALDKGEAIIAAGVALTVDAAAVTAYRTAAAAKAGAA